MIELPEAVTLAGQVAKSLLGRTVWGTVAGASPHRFAFYSGAPDTYPARLNGRTVTGATSHGGILEIAFGDLELRLFDGAHPRLWPAGSALPGKHQLRLDLDDGSTLVVSVAMYGGLHLVPAGTAGEAHHAAARSVPSPLTRGFGPHAQSLLDAAGVERLSLKALLATGQRIPGLGNGVLQDILWSAGFDPRQRVGALSVAQRQAVMDGVTTVLGQIVERGGRDTERDLHGRSGGYPTVMCAEALQRGCPRCGGPVSKATFLGGAIYTCSTCQPLR